MERDQVVVYVAPRHLPSLAAIAAKFKRSPNTIRRWYDEGAPIAFIEGRYSAEYNQLQAWLVRANKKAPKEGGSGG